MKSRDEQEDEEEEEKGSRGPHARSTISEQSSFWQPPQDDISGDDME